MKLSVNLLIGLLLGGVFFSSCRNEYNPAYQHDHIESEIPDRTLVKRPHYWEIVKAGSRFPINWGFFTSAEKVTIKLYEDSAFLSTIIGETENDGLFKWPVASHLGTGHNFKIRIEALNRSDFIESNVFTIEQ